MTTAGNGAGGFAALCRSDSEGSSCATRGATETKELIAGYLLLEVKTLAEAIEWAKRAPFGLGVDNGEEPEVEIRPLFDPADFDVPGEAEERAKRLGKA